MKELIEKHPALSFVVLSYTISWACWLPIIHSINVDLYSSPLLTLVMLFFGGLSPTLSAIIITYVLRGKHGVKELLSGITIFRVKAKWYLFALLTAPAVIGVATMLYLSGGGEVGWVNYQVFLFLPVFYLVAMMLGPITEELGWRGFLLPAVSKRNSFITTALIVGIVHALWHAPLFWATEGTAISGMPVTILSVTKYTLFVVGTSFLYTYVVKHARGSVFIAILIHASINGSHQALNYLFPNIADKLAIWNIEVWVYAIAVTLMVAGSLFIRSHHKKMIQPARQR